MRNYFILFALLAFMMSCNNSDEKKDSGSSDSANVVEQVEVPDFSEDTAFYYVEKQVEFGPRVPGSKAHSDCADFLISRLKSFGLTVQVQDVTARAFTGEILKGKNIIASTDVKKQKRVMLSSHWDSRPFADYDSDPTNHKKAIPGANDGASGVGVLMEVARQISQKPPQVGIDIVFWDIEDYGAPKDSQEQGEDSWCLGSQFWSKNKHNPAYKAQYGILLDMVGNADATFRFEGFSQRYAPSVLRKVWNHAAALGYSNYFIEEESNPIMDDHYYLNMYANIPTIDIICQNNETGTGFYPHWHTMNDDIDKIDSEMLGIVGKVVMRTIYSEK